MWPAKSILRQSVANDHQKHALTDRPRRRVPGKVAQASDTERAGRRRAVCSAPSGRTGHGRAVM